MANNQDYPSPNRPKHEGEWLNVKPPYVNDTTEQRGGLLVHAPNLFTKPNNASLCTTDADKKRETNRYYIKGNDIPPSDPTHVLAFIPRKDGKVPKRRPQSNNILETVIKKHMEESGVNIESAEFRDLILNDNLLTGVKYCVLWNGIKKTKFKENTDWSDKDLAVFDAGATAFDKEKVSHWLKTLIKNMEDLNAYFGCQAVSNSNKRKKSDVADLNFSDLRVANDMTEVERVNDSLQAGMQALVSADQFNRFFSSHSFSLVYEEIKREFDEKCGKDAFKWQTRTEEIAIARSLPFNNDTSWAYRLDKNRKTLVEYLKLLSKKCQATDCPLSLEDVKEKLSRVICSIMVLCYDMDRSQALVGRIGKAWYSQEDQENIMLAIKAVSADGTSGNSPMTKHYVWLFRNIPLLKVEEKVRPWWNKITLSPKVTYTQETLDLAKERGDVITDYVLTSGDTEPINIFDKNWAPIDDDDVALYFQN